MEVRVKIWKVLVVLGVLTAIIIALNSLSNTKHQKEVDKLSMEIYGAKKEIREDSLVIDGLKNQLYETDLIVVSKDKEIRKLASEKDRLKKLDIQRVKTIGELQLALEVAKNNIPPSNTIIIKEMPDGVFAKLPLNYNYSDEWVRMNTKVNISGLADQTFALNPFNINIVLGEKKEGLFKSSSMVSSVTTPNPYLQVQDMRFAIVEDKRKSPNRYRAEGAFVGSLIASGIAIFLTR